MHRPVLVAILLLALPALPARADQAETLCARNTEPAQIIAACTDAIGEKVLRDSASQPRVARAWYGKGLAEIGLGRAAEGNADIAHAQELNSNIATVFSQLGLPPG